VAPPGNQAVNGKNKPQPDVSGETGLFDSNYLHEGSGVQEAAVFIIFQEDCEDSTAILQPARPYVIDLAVKDKVVAEKE